LKLVPGQTVHIALTLLGHGENKIATNRESYFTERSRPQFGGCSQQNRLFAIDFAPMNENQALVGGNKAAHQVPIFSIVKCDHHTHAAGAIDGQDSVKVRVFTPNYVESLPCEECYDITFQVIITH
jgi:hypothetical protein